jgi:hypothetical protein
MTFDDVKRLYAFWRRRPPFRELFGASIGFTPADEEPAEKPKYMTADDARRLMAATGGRIRGM